MPLDKENSLEDDGINRFFISLNGREASKLLYKVVGERHGFIAEMHK